MNLTVRPRRLRGSEALRKMVRETRVDAASLIYPMFVTEGKDKREPIEAMPGQYRYSLDRMGEALDALAEAGVNSIMLFGIPEHKDPEGSQAYAPNGIVQRAVARAKLLHPEMFVITDVCMCEYTSHGHCGVLCDHDVDNDRTLALLAKTALSHVEAGADMVAPSDMMDGRVRAIREALLDVEEGADILMVKPAMAYLDLVREVRDATNLPVAAYSVSGEYAMVKAAAERGWIDERKIVCEMAVAAFRAGAGIYLTYFAKELAECIRAGLIG